MAIGGDNMAIDDFNKCSERFDSNDPLMKWAMYNLKALDCCIKKYGDDIDFLKQVCNNVLNALELAEVNSSLLMLFLNSRGYGVEFKDISKNDEFQKSK